MELLTGFKQILLLKLRGQDSNYNQLSGANSGKIRGASGYAYLKRYEEPRATKKLARIRPPKGKPKNG
jgi:hypothetical protein